MPQRPPSGLPASVRKARIASQRSSAARLCIAFCIAASALTAALITIAAVGLGETTTFFCLFTVPIGISVGAVAGGNLVDNAAKSYRPTL